QQGESPSLRDLRESNRVRTELLQSVRNLVAEHYNRLSGHAVFDEDLLRELRSRNVHFQNVSAGGLRQLRGLSARNLPYKAWQLRLGTSRLGRLTTDRSRKRNQMRHEQGNCQLAPIRVKAVAKHHQNHQRKRDQETDKAR